MLQTPGQEDENAAIAYGRKITREALERLGLTHSEINGHTLRTTIAGKPHMIYISPFGPRYFREKERTFRIRSSSHCVVFVSLTTPVEDVMSILGERVSALKRGQESEEITKIALGRVVKKRPELFVDAYKTGDQADMEGHDFRVGVWYPGTHRILWWGLEVKSSQAGRNEALRKWGKEREQRNGHASPQERPLVRRVICVPQTGDKEERIRITAERIVVEAIYVREHAG